MKPINHILIDDDPLIRKLWKYSALKNDISLKTFSSLEDYYVSDEFQLSKAPLYIDYTLIKNFLPNIFSEQLSNKDVYLSTGYPVDQVIEKHFFKGILNKIPPWELCL